MDHQQWNQGPDPALRRLYPELNDDELWEAETNLEAYLEVVINIFKRLEGRSDDSCDE